MKRKLDQNDVPSPGPKEEKPTAKPKVADEDLTFADLGLDPRLVQAVAEQSFLKPTLVQRKAIPLALNGQDVLCKAKTGSGKTAAYVLPVLAGILKRKAVRADSRTCGVVSHANCDLDGPERIDSGTHPCPDAGTLRSGLQGH